LLAKCLRATYDSLTDQDQRDQISDSVVGVHKSKRRQWSLGSFAKEFLDGAARQAFLEKAPKELHSSMFQFEKEEFERKVNFRIFRLTDDVIVSAPFGTIGKSVIIQGGATRTLKCEGAIIDEKLRAKHA
jgi:hypothetical protein